MFRVLLYSDDPQFCMGMVAECERLSYQLKLVDYNEEIKEQYDIVAVDIGSDFEKARFIAMAKDRFRVPIFAVTNKMNSKLQAKCTDSGASLTFEKKIFIQSLHTIKAHVDNG